jgi:hypothetical protein
MKCSNNGVIMKKLTEVIIIVVVSTMHPTEGEATTAIAEKECHLSLRLVLDYIYYIK